MSRWSHEVGVLLPELCFLLSSLPHMSRVVQLAPIAKSYSMYESEKRPGSQANSVLQIPLDLSNYMRTMKHCRGWGAKPITPKAMGWETAGPKDYLRCQGQGATLRVLQPCLLHAHRLTWVCTEEPRRHGAFIMCSLFLFFSFPAFFGLFSTFYDPTISPLLFY